MKLFKRLTLFVLAVMLTAVVVSQQTYAAPPSNLEDEWREVYFNLGTSFRTYVHDDKLYFVNGDNYTFNHKGLTQGQIFDLEQSGDLMDGLEIFFLAQDYFTKHIEAFDKDGNKINDKGNYENISQDIINGIFETNQNKYEEFIEDFYQKDANIRLYIDLKNTNNEDEYINFLMTKYLNHLINFFKLNNTGTHWYFDIDYVQNNYEEIKFSNSIFTNELDIEDPLHLMNLHIMGLTYNLFDRYSKLEYSTDGITFMTPPVLDRYNEVKHLLGYSLSIKETHLKILNPQSQTPIFVENYNQVKTYDDILTETGLIDEGKLPILKDEHHKFLGWFTQNGTEINLNEPLTSPFIFAKWEPKEDDHYDPTFVFENMVKVLNDFDKLNKPSEIATITKDGAIRVENPYFEGVTEPLDPNPGLPGIIDDANNFIKDNLVYIISGLVVIIGGALILNHVNKTNKKTKKRK